MKIVAHFIRKNSQLRSSFIQNQILNHINYKPVIIHRYNSKKDDGGFAEFQRNDIPILDLSINKKLDLNFRYLKKISKKDVLRVIDFLDKQNVSILHFHYGSDAYIYTDIMKFAQRPSVVSFYGYDASKFYKRFFGYASSLLKIVFSCASAILAMSEEMKKDLIKIGCPEDKIIVHYHGIPTKYFADLKHNYNKILDDFVLLNVAYFDKVKGHIFILKALELLINKGYINIKLKLVGNGPYENRIKKYVKKKKLDKYVIFLGPMKYLSDNFLLQFKNADLFIHPSITTRNDKEGIPGTIVEAMATGLPIISTYHGGIPYIIDNKKSGLLVEEWDILGLANSIITLINNKELREELGQNAKKYALENLDLLQKEKELETIYNNLLNISD